MTVKEKVVRLIEAFQEAVWESEKDESSYPGWRDAPKKCAICGKTPAPYFSASRGLNYCSEKHWKKGV